MSKKKSLPIYKPDISASLAKAQYMSNSTPFWVADLVLCTRGVLKLNISIKILNYIAVAGKILFSNFRISLLVCSAKLRVKIVWGRILARWGRNPLYIAQNPSVRIVLPRQSKTPLYRFPFWLYIRDIIVSGNCQSCCPMRERNGLTWWMHNTTDHESTRGTACQM